MRGLDLASALVETLQVEDQRLRKCQRAEAGSRKETCPDQRLGLELLTQDFWKRLQTTPDRLLEEPSVPEVTP